jgi:alkanesulfonate monooxygenase SsuD/methylene tetrahydromethanopterin reductase-like flavin-dependent oxidoreductase (luciferase family)
MHVGYSIGFQNPDEQWADEQVYDRELRLADLAVELGFESLWAVEHHFTDYLLSPDPLQLLAWLGARHRAVRLGTAVVVLPWHEPVRCAERIAQLDNLSEGRLILGLGRGLAKVEYDGFGVEMDTSRARFVAYADLIVGGLESGFVEADNEFVTVPRRELRPRPRYSMQGRVYAGALSPEAMPLMAELGVGLLIIPQKPWPAVRADMDAYAEAWRRAWGPSTPPPAPLCGGQVYVDRDPDRARDMAARYIGGYYHTVMKHYEFHDHAHDGVRGYEYYAGVSRHIDRHGTEGAARDFVDLMPWGTPDQVLERLAELRDVVGMSAFFPWFSYAGMPAADAEASVRLFAREVLPVVQTWDTAPLPVATPRRPAAASSAHRS